MIEIICKNYDNGNGFGSGFPVEVRLLPAPRGAAETLPDFFFVKITDTDDVSGWTDPWMRHTTYEILQHDPVSDFFRVKLLPTDNHLAAALTVAEMQEFLTNWGASLVEQEDAISVVFEITAMAGIRNSGLFSFGEEDAFCKYTEISYNAEAGTHEVELDYSLSKLSAATVRSTLTNCGMNVVTNDGESGKCTFLGYRAQMIGELETQIAHKFNIVLSRVLNRFSDATVQAAIANGGTIEMTLAEAEAALVDVSAETQEVSEKGDL